VADPSAYAENVEAAEFRHDANPLRWPASTIDLEHEDDDMAPVLQTLWFWSDEWRTLHSQELGDRKATVASEANFIRWALDWAWDNEIHWDDFAADMRNARRRLENLLRDGERAELTRVQCDRETCERQPRLIRIYGDDPTGDGDFWKCPACKSHFTLDDLQRAQARQLRQEGAAKFVPLRDAVGVLTNLGRPERTIRAWLADPDDPVEVYCEVGTRRALVWWPDLWRRHHTTRTRKRVVA
jgi:hypothetical protein